MKILPQIQPSDLKKKIERLWEVSAGKILSIDREEVPGGGTPVYTVQGKYTSRGWTEWTQGFQFGSAVLVYDATDQREFLETKLQPALDAAVAGTGHVFFVDAAHFVYGTFLCCLWTIARRFIRAASGRQRFNVLGAWNAVTRKLLTVTNTTVVNTDTMCELLRTIAAEKLIGPVTVVLDNARYQRNNVVQNLAIELSITLLFLPSYSPNLNLIERLWGFAKRQSVYGKYHPNFASFRAAIEDTLTRVPTTHADKLASLMTLRFQTFEDVSLLAA